MPCLPPRLRHRYNAQGFCKGCGEVREPADRNESQPPLLTAAIPNTITQLPIGQPVLGSEVKLEALSEALESYLNSKDALLKFLRQHSGTELLFEDPIETATQTFLDSLYRDLGRELFWRKKRNGKND